MAKIHVQREHHLTREQARAQVEELASRLERELKVQHAWEGDVMRFKRAGASGEIAIDDKTVDVKVELGMVLTPMKGKIERAILANLDKVQTVG